MIDLRKPLPTALIVDGRPYPIDTSFRVWLDIQERCRAGFPIGLCSWIFTGETPKGYADAAAEFLMSKNRYPKRTDGGEETLDVFDDGDYIVAAFQQAYGIDLTTCDMHWHRFLALLRGNPECTYLSTIMGHRAYRKQTGKNAQEKALKDAHDAWKIRKPDPKVIAKQKDIFYGCWGGEKNG